MNKMFLFLWNASGVAVALMFGAYGVMFIGAIFSINEPPAPSLMLQALAFTGAAIQVIERILKQDL